MLAFVRAFGLGIAIVRRDSRDAARIPAYRGFLGLRVGVIYLRCRIPAYRGFPIASRTLARVGFGFQLATSDSLWPAPQAQPPD